MTWIYDTGTISKGFAPEYQTNATCYFCGSEFSQLPIANIPTGITGYIVDWESLDASTQTTIGSKLLMFDDIAKVWRPQ